MTASKVHPWIYTIIPVEIGADKDQTFINYTQVLFSAFCKDCRTYFTETIPWSTGGAIFTESSLPREGCGTLEEAAEGFSTLPGIDR